MRKILFILFIALCSKTASAQGDSCGNAIPMPYSAISILPGNILAAGQLRWYSFVPLTTEIDIKLTNTNPSAGHVHDILLAEGMCSLRYHYIANSKLGGHTDSTLDIHMHDLVVGVPYYLLVMREHPSCLQCNVSTATFDLEVQSQSPPSVTVINNFVYLNGTPSHKKNEVSLRINKDFLKMTNVDNTTMIDKPMTVFVHPAKIADIAHKIFNDDHVGLGQLHLTKIYPTMTSADTISISRDSQIVHIPAFYETFTLTIPDTMSVFKTSRILSTIDGIRYAEPNYAATLCFTPDDPLFATNQASLHPIGTYTDAHINVEGAWTKEMGKSAVKIGVYDGGVDQTHSELNGVVAGGMDYFNSPPTALIAPYDATNHGTECGGIIAARLNNAVGISGIAGGTEGGIGCTLYDMKIFHGPPYDPTIASDDKIAPAIKDGATSVSAGGFGLHIMNHSWSEGNYSYKIHDAIQYADRNGVVVLASRGNLDVGLPTTLLTQIRYPACFQDEMVINVGANGTDGNWKTITNGNPSDAGDMGFQSKTQNNIDVIAPGTNAVVYSTQGGTGGYQGFNGTSSACAHASGVAGLLLSYVDDFTSISAHNNLVVEDVEYLLQKSATDITLFPCVTGYDDASGWGRINATAAINMIEKPEYKIQHFQPGDGITSFTFVGGGATGSTTVHLANDFTNDLGITTPAGTYPADYTEQIITLNYSLSSSTDMVITGWPRFSSTSGWSFASPTSIDSWCEIISPVTATSTTLRTYTYQLHLPDGTFAFAPCHTLHARVAISIYTLTAPASVNDINKKLLSLNAYPNPAANSTTICFTLPTAQEISLELYDILGKPIKTIAKGNFEKGNHQYQLPLSEIPAGMYFYKLVTDNATSTQKLIIK